jgi:hypothetical protein
MENESFVDQPPIHDGPVMIVVFEGGSVPRPVPEIGGVELSSRTCRVVASAVRDNSASGFQEKWNGDGEPSSELDTKGAISALRSLKPSHLYVVVGSMPLQTFSASGRKSVYNFVMALDALKFESRRISMVFSSVPDVQIQSDWALLLGQVTYLCGVAGHLAFDALARSFARTRMPLETNNCGPLEIAHGVMNEVWSGTLIDAKSRLHGFELVSQLPYDCDPTAFPGGLRRDSLSGHPAIFVAAIYDDAPTCIWGDEYPLELRLSLSSDQDVNSAEVTKEMHRSASFCSAWKSSRCALLLAISGNMFICSWSRVALSADSTPRWKCMVRYLSNDGSTKFSSLDVAAFRRYDLGIVGKHPIVNPISSLCGLPKVVVREMDNETFDLMVSKNTWPTPELFLEYIALLSRRKIGSTTRVRPGDDDQRKPDSCSRPGKLIVPEHTILKEWDRLKLPQNRSTSAIDLAIFSSQAGSLKRPRIQADVLKQSFGDHAAAVALRKRRSLFPSVPRSQIGIRSSRRLSLASHSISNSRLGAYPGRSIRSSTAFVPGWTASPSGQSLPYDFRKLGAVGRSSSQEDALNALNQAKAGLRPSRSTLPPPIYGVDYCMDQVGARVLEQAIEDYEASRFRSGLDFDSKILQLSAFPEKFCKSTERLQKSIQEDFDTKMDIERTADLSGAPSRPEDNGAKLFDKTAGSALIHATHAVLSPEEVADCLANFVCLDDKSFTSLQRQWLPALLKVNCLNFTLSSRALLASAPPADELASILLEGRVDGKGRDGVYYMIREWIENVRNGEIILKAGERGL